MKAEGLLAVALLAYPLATQVQADFWDSAEESEVRSENGKYMLRIEPHRDRARKPGHCRATLLQGTKVVWSRHLVNNHAPVRVFVANSGEYVLTMDEWHSVGKLPVVVYGRAGELVRVHSTDSLGLKDDIRHIKRTASSYWWNEDSISFFGPDEETFFIRLHWGKLILLRLRDGELMDKEWLLTERRWKKLREFGGVQVKNRAIRLLDSQRLEERKAGALICGQEKLREAIPKLRKLLEHKSSIRTNVPIEWTRVYHVRKAAKQALAAMGQKVEGVVTCEPLGR